MKYYFCLDIGGTGIKCGIIDGKNNILFNCQYDSKLLIKTKDFAETISNILLEIESNSKLKIEKSAGIGIGLPGIIDPVKGIVKFSQRFNLHNYPLVEKLSKKFKTIIKITNDAELATLCELKIGYGQTTNNFVFLTLGTGIGSGIVIDGKSIRTNLPYSCELGHNFFEKNEYEKYASAKALDDLINNKLFQTKNNKILEKYKLKEINGKILFQLLNKEKIFNDIFNEYITNLGKGIVNIVNTFGIDTIILGGSISQETTKLTIPLEKFVNKNIFAKNSGFQVKILSSTKTKFAGIVGAKQLFN